MEGPNTNLRKSITYTGLSKPHEGVYMVAQFKGPVKML